MAYCSHCKNTGMTKYEPVNHGSSASLHDYCFCEEGRILENRERREAQERKDNGEA